MSELTATGDTTVVSRGFSAYGEIDRSEGRRGRSALGSFSTLDEAIAAARGQGVQGDDGSVGRFEVLLYAGGLVITSETSIFGRRQAPDRSYPVGFSDLREYEFGVRPALAGPVRPAKTSILDRGALAIPDAEAELIRPVALLDLRRLLEADPDGLIGVWRRVGDGGWRGEFPGELASKPTSWLPSERMLLRLAG